MSDTRSMSNRMATSSISSMVQDAGPWAGFCIALDPMLVFSATSSAVTPARQCDG